MNSEYHTLLAVSLDIGVADMFASLSSFYEVLFKIPMLSSLVEVSFFSENTDLNMRKHHMLCSLSLLQRFIRRVLFLPV